MHALRNCESSVIALISVGNSFHQEGAEAEILDQININLEKLQSMIASLADKSTLCELYSLHSPSELDGRALR